MTDANLQARFDAKASPEPNTGCLLWFGLRNGDGYGRFWTGRRFVSAHRFSWEHANGRSAAGQVVRHRCDTPECVNPEHLVIGTATDNARDRDERGRGARGERNGRAKLNACAVRDIRARLAASESLEAIASSYGVNKRVVYDIKVGRLWRHVS